MISQPPPPRRSADPVTVPIARAVLTHLLARHARDPVVVREAGRTRTFGPPTGEGPTVVVRDPRAWVAVGRDGSAGLGEAYFRGWWDCTDPVAFVRLLIRATAGLDALRNRGAALTAPLLDPLRRRRRHDPGRDRDNIRAHYDVGNDFFALLLDPTMTYSCAVFESSDDTLEAAQRRKIDGWCRRLGLGPGAHLAEIGSGWGGLAVHAATAYGARVTTTTISDAQHEWVTKRVAEAGLEDRVTVLDADYRDLPAMRPTTTGAPDAPRGGFDRVVSIEMIEGVDWREYDEYFGTIARLLSPDGLAGVQAIVVADQRYERAKNSEEYIRRWIFPGGCLPSITAISDTLTRHTDLRMVELVDIGPHYAETLRRWRENLNRHAGALPDLGLDEQFRRMFEFYLAYCEAAFRERHVSVVQLLLAKPGWRGVIAGPSAG